MDGNMLTIWQYFLQQSTDSMLYLIEIPIVFATEMETMTLKNPCESEIDSKWPKQFLRGKKLEDRLFLISNFTTRLHISKWCGIGRIVEISGTE
jgi:hypothetical protein